MDDTYPARVFESLSVRRLAYVLLIASAACVIDIDNPNDDGVHPCDGDTDCLPNFACGPDQRCWRQSGKENPGGDSGSGSTDAPKCGDGIVQAPEECDAASANADSSACTADCKLAKCGDGHVRLGVEVCDDGNTDDCRGDCRGDCQARITGCGDGVACAPEVCDDGNINEQDGCRSDCTPAQCGDGVVRLDAQPGSGMYEECDDGSNNSDTTPDACRASCLRAHCGDGVIDTGEVCDPGGETAECDVDCTLPSCGDGVVNASAGEQCDDGNTADADGCWGSCQLPCEEEAECPANTFCLRNPFGPAEDPGRCSAKSALGQACGGKYVYTPCVDPLTCHYDPANTGPYGGTCSNRCSAQEECAATELCHDGACVHVRCAEWIVRNQDNTGYIHHVANYSGTPATIPGEAIYGAMHDGPCNHTDPACSFLYSEAVCGEDGQTRESVCAYHAELMGDDAQVLFPYHDQFDWRSTRGACADDETTH